MGAVELISLNCNHCGAPLEAAADTRFLTCGHCGSRLAVHHTASTHFTEVLQKLGAKTETVAHDVEILKLENELLRLQQQWETERETFMVTARDGSRRLPERRAGAMMVVGWLFIAPLLVCILIVGPGGGILPALALLVGAIVMTVRSGNESQLAAEHDRRFAWYAYQHERVRRELARLRSEK